MNKYIVALMAGFLSLAANADIKIANASYDISVELFADYNKEFQEYWNKQNPDNPLTIIQTHGASTKQAKSVTRDKKNKGVLIDVVTFNQISDIQLLVDESYIGADWDKENSNNSSPYYSTIAFLVKKGNPKKIKNWDDLIKEDVGVIFPDPRSSGNGRYTYAAIYGYAKDKFAGKKEEIDNFLREVTQHIVVLESGGRGAREQFIKRNVGDVLITFEAEALSLAAKEPDKYEVVVPSESILVEFFAAVVDKNAKKQQTKDVASKYVEYLFSTDGQKLLANHNYRVRNPEVFEANKNKFKDLKLKTIEQIAGSWKEFKAEYLSDGGKFEQFHKAMAAGAK